MNKLTTEITIEELQYRIHAHENDLTQMWTADYFLNVQKELLALKQAAKNPVEYKVVSRFGDISLFNQECEAEMYRNMKGFSVTPLYTAPPVQPVIPEHREYISFDTLMAAVSEVTGAKSEFDATPEKCYQAVPFMNFNSLSRIVEMFRKAQPVSEPYKLEIDMDDADHFSITHLHEIIYGKELIWPEAKLLARFMLDVKQRASAAPARESE